MKELQKKSPIKLTSNLSVADSAKIQAVSVSFQPQVMNAGCRVSVSQCSGCLHNQAVLIEGSARIASQLLEVLKQSVELLVVSQPSPKSQSFKG